MIAEVPMAETNPDSADGGIADGETEKPAASSLSQAAQARAEAILLRKEQAVRTGDEGALSDLVAEVTNDPELDAAIKDHLGNQYDDSLDKEQELDQERAEEVREVVMQSIEPSLAQLIKLARENPHDTNTYLTEDHADAIIPKLVALTEAIQSGSTLADMNEAVKKFSNFYDQLHAVAKARMMSLVGYFGGNAPPELIRQAVAFDNIEDELGKLNQILNQS